jgi:hypothetical protein
MLTKIILIIAGNLRNACKSDQRYNKLHIYKFAGPGRQGMNLLNRADGCGQGISSVATFTK